MIFNIVYDKKRSITKLIIYFFVTGENSLRVLINSDIFSRDSLPESEEDKISFKLRELSRASFFKRKI